MATVGHTLVGLSLGGAWQPRTGSSVFRSMWPGLAVLAAHSIDLVEWGLTLADPRHFSQHEVTHSPWLIAGVLTAGWVAIALFVGFRSVWPFAIVLIAVGSHVVMDRLDVRAFLLDAYGRESQMEGSSLRESIEAELWLYGALLILVGLVQTLREPAIPRPGKRLSWLLIAVCLSAAASRRAAIWGPSYVVAGIHLLFAFRRRLHRQLAWSLVPLAPLFALIAIEIRAGQYEQRGTALESAGHFAGAVRMYDLAIDLPRRSAPVNALIRAGWCYQKLGDLAAAERSFLLAERRAEARSWPRLSLARFYVAPAVRGTPYYQPDSALRLLTLIIDDPRAGRFHAIAEATLRKLYEQGTLQRP